jgi:hypothetical protein
LSTQIEAQIQEQLEGLPLKDAKEREKYLIRMLAEAVVALIRFALGGIMS